MRKGILLGLAVAVSLACGGAPLAVAAPTGGYAVFAQCPTQQRGVPTCLYASIEGGYITLGKALVPLAKPVALQGGLRHQEAGASKLVAAVDGETLTKVGQTLPGGLFGLSLEAVTELAAPASSIELRGGASSTDELNLALPIKVRLVNPLLGVECSLGSDAHPIELSLTTGTSGGLTGNPGKIGTLDGGGILLRSGLSMVGSGFAVPKAQGCGLAVVDEAFDAKLGLPSSKNTITTFNLKLELANAELVEGSED